MLELIYQIIQFLIIIIIIIIITGIIAKRKPF